MVHPFPQRKIRVLIVEDSTIVADKFMQLLSTHNDIDVVGVAHNISFANQMIALQKPDAVMIDIHLEADAPSANGITLLAMLQLQHPNLKKIMLTNMVEDVYREKCLDLGASHFIDKSDDFEKVLEAIRTINMLKPSH